MSPNGRTWHCTLVWLICPLLCVGCAHLPGSNSFPTWLAKSPTEQTTSAASCTVEFRASGRSSKTVSIPVTGETRVQEVLESSRALSKFRNLSVYVLRRTPESTEPALKMVCRFDRKSRHITFETDYAVLPGDRIFVSEDHSSRFDQILTSVVGPVMAHH